MSLPIAHADEQTAALFFLGCAPPAPADYLVTSNTKLFPTPDLLKAVAAVRV
jgi:hypothetical protein